MSTKVKAVFFVIGFGVFVYLVSEFGLTKILDNIERTGWWFLPVIGVWGIVYIINAAAWYFIVDAKSSKLSFGKIYQITVSGFAINYLTPFVNLGGEPYRIAALKNSLGLTKSISSVIIYTMLHFLSHFIFWISAIVIAGFTLSLSFRMQLILMITLFVLILFTYFMMKRHKKGVAQLLFKSLSGIPGISNLQRKIENKKTFMHDVDEKISRFYYERKFSFFSALGLDLLSRFVAIFEFYFILQAIGINASLIDSFFIAAGSSLIMNIFFFIPLTLGVREGGLLLMMQLLNFTAGVGIYVSIVNRIRELFWIFIGLMLIQFFRKPNQKEIPAKFIGR